MNLTPSRHAETRMRQRGLRGADIALVLDCATEMRGDSFFLSNQDAAREIEKRRREIQALERLRGTKVVVGGDTLVTCCHMREKPAKAPRNR